MPTAILQSLLETVGATYASADRAEIIGNDPIFDTPFRVSEAAAAMDKAKPVRSGPKVGRNDPCPCRSGKKFKHCCGKNG